MVFCYAVSLCLQASNKLWWKNLRERRDIIARTLCNNRLFSYVWPASGFFSLVTNVCVCVCVLLRYIFVCV